MPGVGNLIKVIGKNMGHYERCGSTVGTGQELGGHGSERLWSRWLLNCELVNKVTHGSKAKAMTV